jgi:hypothetical protein
MRWRRSASAKQVEAFMGGTNAQQRMRANDQRGNFDFICQSKCARLIMDYVFICKPLVSLTEGRKHEGFGTLHHFTASFHEAKRFYEKVVRQSDSDESLKLAKIVLHVLLQPHRFGHMLETPSLYVRAAALTPQHGHLDFAKKMCAARPTMPGQSSRIKKKKEQK